jgi:hydroxymethylpyrimidine kinase/phosphomethylpyrimidine kinase
MEGTDMKKILTIAGSDSGGGAGIQADLKAITVLGGYGMSVITALTAQNTVGVQGVHPVPIPFIKQQLESVLSDIGTDAAKTGMLANPEIVRVVVAGLKKYHVQPLVVDPVMVATSGDSLLSEDAVETLKQELFPLAYMVTPNLSEATLLCGFKVTNIEEMEKAARQIHALGPRIVLIKGGHLEGEIVDLLFDGQSIETFKTARIDRQTTHGTGCTLSAALATFLAQGLSISNAVGKAKQFITRAISMGLEIGSGQGPTNPYAHILILEERERVLKSLRKSLDLLKEHPLGNLIPEVRSNFVYALTGAQGYQEVAGVPGRITQVGDQILVSREPAFGATRHIARVVLAAMQYDPGFRSVMNIRHNTAILDACKRLGFSMASFDRHDETTEVKEREGSSLEWGTHQALKGIDTMPDLVFDDGDVGKEPMIRVLGKNPREVVEKVVRIGKAYGKKES